MLTAEFRVNGFLISYITAINKGLADIQPPLDDGADPGSKKPVYRYEVEMFLPGQPDGLRRLDVLHVREDGARVLMRKVLEAVSVGK